MARVFTEEEVARHDSLTERGWALSKEQIHLGGAGASGPPGWLGRRKLREAIRCFEEAVNINPEGWSSMWALGKIYQRLRQHEVSFEWFYRAYELNPDQPDVAREAGLAAMDCGRAGLAVKLCSAAVSNNSDDAGHVANLALAHMLDGNDASALECASRAASLDPKDPVSRAVQEYVREVADGRRPRPERLADAFPH